MRFDDAAIMNKYSDATVPSRPPTPAAALHAVATNLARNGPRLVAVFSSARAIERGTLGALLMLSVVAVIYGAIVWKRDLFPLAAGIMAMGVIAAVMLFYSPHGFRGVRMLLFTYPLLVVCAARGVTEFDARRWFPRHGRALRVGAYLGLAAWVGISVSTIARAGRTLRASDAADDAALAVVESLHHDDRRMLVAPFWVALPYVFAHYPVRWAYVPKNRPTLELLDQKYDIGTFIVPADRQGTDLTRDDLEAIGLKVERRLGYQGVRYLVFKRASASGQ
jgi:hypothetical protein